MGSSKLDLGRCSSYRTYPVIEPDLFRVTQHCFLGLLSCLSLAGWHDPPSQLSISRRVCIQSFVRFSVRLHKFYFFLNRQLIQFNIFLSKYRYCRDKEYISKFLAWFLLTIQQNRQNPFFNSPNIVHIHISWYYIRLL